MSAQPQGRAPTPAEVEQRRKEFNAAREDQARYLSLRAKLCERMHVAVDTTSDAQIIGMVDRVSEWVRHLPSLREQLGIKMHKGISVVASIEHVVRKLRLLEAVMHLDGDMDDDGSQAAGSYRQLRAYLELPEGARVAHLAHAAMLRKTERDEAAKALAAHGIELGGLTPWWVVAQLASENAVLRAQLEGRTP